LNIFLDPGFAVGGDFRLAADSPCVDAGFDGLRDGCLPPARGTDLSDLGAFGGPLACAWPLLDCDTPEITREPVRQVVCLGGSAVFTVVAGGTEPLSYQWFTEAGVAVPGGTNASFQIAPVQAADAGGYYVVVSNPCGSVASRVASLDIPLVCLSIDLYAGLSMGNLEPGQIYDIQYLDTLGPTNEWKTMTNFQATVSDLFWVDPEPARGRQKYYRVLPQPAP
jgi:Immunoglobulin domain